MSFGTVIAMIISLKNNARPRKKAFEYSKEKDLHLRKHYSLKYKKVSVERLIKIKRAIKSNTERENTRRFLITMAITIPVSIALVAGAVNYTAKVKQHNQEVFRKRKERLELQKKRDAAWQRRDFTFFINAGDSLFNAKKYHDAKIYLTNACEINPENYIANFCLTEAYIYDCIYNDNDCYSTKMVLDKTISTYGETAELVELKMKLKER